MKKFLLKNKIVISVVAVVLTLGVFGIAKADSSLIDKFLQIAGIRFADNLASKIDVGEVSDQLIGGTNPDFQTNWYRFGGVLHYANSVDMAAGTTTCSMISPSNGTSTLIFASANFTHATSAAITTMQWGKASNPNSTTTQIGGDLALAASASATINASTTRTAQIDDTKTFAPNTYLNLKGVTATGNDFTAPLGVCRAEWIVNQ